MINHSYLLISSDTMLMHEYALLVASEIMCKADTRPCHTCNTCVRIQHGNYPDVAVYPKGDAILTEDINQIVFDEYVLPLEADKKVYILYNLDNATVQAQNKLLKTLEEPNKSVIFVITASNMSNVLPTISSRCKKVVEPTLSDDIVAGYLVTQGLDSTLSNAIAKRSYGNLTLALSHATSKTGQQMIALSKEIFNNLTDSSKVIVYASKMLQFKTELEDLINQMQLSVRDIALQIVNGGAGEYNVQMYNIKALQGISELCQQAVAKLRANCNASAVVDGLLMGILEVRYKCLK